MIILQYCPTLVRILVERWSVSVVKVDVVYVSGTKDFNCGYKERLVLINLERVAKCKNKNYNF